MKQTNQLNPSAWVLSAIALVAGISPSVLATPNPLPESESAVSEQEMLLTQGLTGQCRQANKQIPVFSERDATSEARRLLPRGTEVTLAGSGADGFIGISTPTTGFVHTVNLTTCTGTQPPPASACRRVIQPAGLAIRSQASTSSTLVGGVSYLSQVSLSSTPPTVQRGSGGRNWIQIAQPRSGWVSNGFPGGNSNLGYCL